MPSRLAVCLLALLGVAAGAASANEAKIRQTLQARFPTMVVESVAPAPFAGLYEVVLDGEIVYTDEKTEYFFSGGIYDIRTLPPRNLTQERTERVAAKTLTGASDLAIKRVKGSGSRVLFTFEDPNCGYCKALHKELARLDDVTIYTFLLPVLSQNSVDKSVAVWCATDRAQAWDDLMSTGALPEGGKACANPLDRIAALARRFQIQGTPAIFLGGGKQIGGMRSAADIEKAFSAAR